MGFVWRTITKMADKIAPHISVRCRGHSYLVIFMGFLPNFLYGLLPSNSCSSSNTGLVGGTIIKMADKMAATYPFALVDNLP